MFYQFAQHLFEFYFQVDYPITWNVTDSDVRLAIYNTALIDHQTRFVVQASIQVDHDTRFDIFSLESIDHDTGFNIASVTKGDTRYVVTASALIDHDTSLVIQAAGVNIDHATQFIVREEDSFTN